MSNHLKNETSPYLLQHADNPVDWYPWGDEAFEKAKTEDKPVFLSIGYSTCHWCHVMAHESFEDGEIAQLLNSLFVAIKVDKEERQDIDSVYMAVCQAFTGSGGWPMSIFMTAEKKPFFAGTYFPKTAKYGSAGLRELLINIHSLWENDRERLLSYADETVSVLRKSRPSPQGDKETLIEKAVESFSRSFDKKYGGFGSAPKFPAAHNLLFLLQYAKKHDDSDTLQIVETTLQQMYRGGIFDHIGGGFCRYSTDRYFLVPHFEKMLYDNALLILSYCRAHELTGKSLYIRIAEKTAEFLFAEMRSPDGGFYCAQDADSDGEEGKFYVFTPREIISLLGAKKGAEFNSYYGITDKGNFNGKSIPNLLGVQEITNSFDGLLPQLIAYRKSRTVLLTDDKILTSWNSLMIAALCSLYRATHDERYLSAAKQTRSFIEEKLRSGDSLYVSYRNGKHGSVGLLDDYACYIYALIALYDVTLDRKYLNCALNLTRRAEMLFFDGDNGGFYLYSGESETLIIRPKEAYDGALPSGNSLMTYNLVRLSFFLQDDEIKAMLEKQLHFMSGEAAQYPAGYTVFLMALSDYLDPSMSVTVAGVENELSELPFRLASDAAVRLLDQPTPEYPQLNGQTTFYCCVNRSCLPPMNKKEFYDHNKV